MRILIALAALLLLTTFAPVELFSEPPAPQRTLVEMNPIPLDERDPGRRQVGRLLYLGGWEMRSNDPRFGGISAMHVEDGEVMAVSDSGSVIRFRLAGASASILPLPSGPGSSARKSNRDSEALAVHRQNAWIAFEGENQVWRYSRGDWRRRAAAAPAAMEKWPSNAGTEAMLRLADGRFLLFAEGEAGGEGATAALLFEGDPADAATKSAPIAYRAPKGYRITDAALLPGGGILFLNRRFTVTEGVSAKLTVAPKQRIAAGMTLQGAEIAELRPPLAVDNMEALSVTLEGGRTIVWIASDDNFNPLQRTLLLKFALEE